MSADTPQSASPSGWSLVSVLPAVTLLALVNLFAVQAIMAADRRPLDAHGSQRHATGAQTETLPVLGRVQDFSLTERSGKPVAQSQLLGKVWVADFIFTTCTAECPLMSVEMQKLQTTFASSPELRLVSFSVDPETDTPAVLSSYADRYQADAERWWFVTGARPALYDLAIKGFKLPVQDLRADHDHAMASDQKAPGHDDHAMDAKDAKDAKASDHGSDHGSRLDKQSGHDPGAGSDTGSAAPPAKVSSPFMHSQKFVLVDQNLQIRGYYDSLDRESMDKLIKTDLPHLLTGS